MEASQSDHMNTRVKIEDWQNGPSAELIIGENGIIARLLQGCLDLFSSLLSQMPESALVSKKDENTLRRCFATLTLWADGHGALEGKLDRLLERSTALQYPTVATLNSLCGVLVNRLSKLVLSSSNEARLALLRNTNTDALYEQTKWFLAGLDDVATDSSSDSESSADEAVNSDIKSVVGEVRTYVGCLVDLSSALECPAIDPDHAEDESSIPRLEKRSAHEYYSDLIIAKYPNANIDLVECLGKANWDRYQRLQMERSNNVNDRTAPLETSSVRSAASKSHLADSEFRDSGLGTSIPTQSTKYAETIISFISSVSGGKRVKMPPLPAEGRNGQQFECLACGKYIRATTNRDWRNHLFGDTLPYTCFHPRCGFSTVAFSTRRQWSDHLGLDHHFGPDWADRQCPLCLEPTGAGKNVMLIHFARHMEEIALAALPHGMDSEAYSEAASDIGSDTGSNKPPSINLQLPESYNHLSEDESQIPDFEKQFCLGCNRHMTNGDIYCSEPCRSTDMWEYPYVSEFGTLYPSEKVILLHLLSPSSKEHHVSEIHFRVDVASDHASIINTLRKHYDLTGQHKLGLEDRFGNSLIFDYDLCEDGMEIFVRVEKNDDEEVEEQKELELAAPSPIQPENLIPKEVFVTFENNDDEEREQQKELELVAPSPIQPENLIHAHVNEQDDDTSLHETSSPRERLEQPQINASPSTRPQDSGQMLPPAKAGNSPQKLSANAMEKLLERKAEIERRCQLLDPPITEKVLQHMIAFEAALQPHEPLTEEAWADLKPHLIAELPNALKIEDERRKEFLEKRAKFEARPPVPYGSNPFGEDQLQSNKRHKCPYCDKDFTRHHNLKSHLLTHSQEKPYECPVCQARFRRLHDLKRHHKRHSVEPHPFVPAIETPVGAETPEKPGLAVSNTDSGREVHEGSKELRQQTKKRIGSWFDA